MRFRKATTITQTPDPIDIGVGARIRAKRSVLKISQTKLADEVGVTFQQIQKYERGANRVSASMLVHIAHALDVPAAALLGEEDEVGPRQMAIFRSLHVAGAAELLEAFARIPNPALRTTLVKLAKLIAKDEAEAGRD